MKRLSAERWQQIDTLFAAALERAPEEREAFLATTCGDDPELYRAVVTLLEIAAAAEAELGESASEYAEPLMAELHDGLNSEDLAHLPENGRIGPYRILREVGRGGMGAVYLAERADGEFEKQVALKLVKRGMDSDEVLRRFRHERQILATLEHPHIARLYDGGVADDGRPYLVMEYIEGEPITRYCDERRLSVENRLHLFARVCAAVQFAHHRLVIHRDIKPSNILVTADGTPKLLDFGIAKLLDPAVSADARTRTEMRLLTPEYASPEQAEGGPVTTASDVYTLGILLYELLTGRRPREHGGRRADDGLGEVERPSSVVMRDLPDRTGGSGPTPAAEIAARRGSATERLRRCLRGDLDTIALRALAAEPDRRYPSAEQLWADVERHLRGLPVEARGDSPAYRARKFVRRHRAGVFAASLVALSLVGGLGAAVSQARRAASERDAAQQERAKAEQVSTFLLSLFDAADPRAAQPAGGDTLRARDLLDRGAERVRRELAGQPRLQAQMLSTLGRIYGNLGMYEAGRSLLDDALALQNGSVNEIRDRATTLALLGELHRREGKYARSDSLYAQVIALYDAQRWTPDSLYVWSLSERGFALSLLGQGEEAAALHQRAYDHLQRQNRRDGRLYGYIANNLGELHYELGEYALAESLFRESARVDRTLLGPDHPDLSASLNNLASSIHYHGQGRYAEAEPLYQEAITIARRAYGETHPQVGQFLENLATLHDDRGAHREAESLYREALGIYATVFGRSSVRTAVLLRNLAANRYDVSELAEAEALLRESIAIFEAELGPDHLYTTLAHLSLGRTLTAAGKTDEALHLLRSGLGILERQLPEGHFRLHAARGDLGACLAARGEYEGAEPLLLASYAALRADKGDAYYATRMLREHLYRLYTAWGKHERASEYRTAAMTP
jgi:serine/threonine protein kinase